MSETGIAAIGLLIQLGIMLWLWPEGLFRRIGLVGLASGCSAFAMAVLGALV